MKRFKKLFYYTTIYFYKDKTNAGFIYLEELSIIKDMRGMGLVRKELTHFISWVKQYTDAYGITLFANPLDDETDYDRLVAFYESFGFVDDGNGFMMLDFRC